MNYVDLLYKTGSLMNGHFLLASGKHSSNYVQCAKLLEYPENAETIAQGILDKVVQIGWDTPTVCIGAATGGITIAYELARQFHCRGIFCEKSKKNNFGFELRRGFSINQDDKILLVEDVLTTGGSIRKIYDLLESKGHSIIGIASIIDRRIANNYLSDLNVISLIKLEFKTYNPDKCPLCEEKKPLIHPGSTI